MAQTVKWQPTAEEISEVEEALKTCIDEIERATELMAQDQAEIDRLKAETRAILATLQVT